MSIVAAGSCVSPPQLIAPPGATGASDGCGITTRGAVTDRSETIWVDGAGRRYVITVPPVHVPGATDPVPLVLDFHGLIEGMVGTHPLATQFGALAQTEGFVVASPIGSNGGFDWDVFPQESNGDLRFIDRLVERLENTLCIDRSRIYITGLSYGAAMTSMLMCMRPNTFAAAAPVAGLSNLCGATERSVPFVSFHGTADPILPFGWFVDAPQDAADTYGCEHEPTSTVVGPNPDPVTWGPITHHVWDCSDVGTSAEFYVICGGGHTWPASEFFAGIEFIVGRTTMELDATEVIWEFFSRHSLDGPPSA